MMARMLTTLGGRAGPLAICLIFLISSGCSTMKRKHEANPNDRNPDDANQKYEVSVRLANNQSKFFYVMGAVGNQGRFKSTGNETVLDAILQAGLRSNSLPDKTYVARPHPAGGPDIILKVDWFGIRDRGDTLTNYQLQPGDRVIVPGTKPPGVIGSLLGG